MRKQVIRLYTLFLAIFLLLSAVSAYAETSINLVRQESNASFVSYPQISGMDNTFVQDTINAAVLEKTQPHLNTLMVLQSGVAGELKAESQVLTFTHKNGQDVLAVLLVAEGRMPNGRGGYQANPMMFSLADGQAIPVEKIFSDAEEAREKIEEELDGAFADELSNYLDISALAPFPIENYLLTDTGITFYYPENSLTWLSGRGASVHFLYHEIRPLLDMKEGSLLVSLDIPMLGISAEEASEFIRKSVADGKLPGLDVRLGDQIESAIDKNKLQYDPEGFPTGEKYQLEDDRYRGTKVIVNDEGLVTALISTRMNLFGLITGESGMEEAESLLGTPLAILPMDEGAATLYSLPRGTLLTYRISDNDLKLFFDQAGTLYAVWLEKTN